MTEQGSWTEIKNRRLAEPASREAYERARRAVGLGEAVRAERERLGLSQSELARRTGTSQSVIARLESGAVLPTIETLERVAGALEVELSVEFRPRRGRKVAS